MEYNKTQVYTSSVEYYNQTLPMKDGKYEADGMDFAVLATSFAEAEEMIKEAVGEDLIRIWGIELMDAVALFK